VRRRKSGGRLKPAFIFVGQDFGLVRSLSVGRRGDNTGRYVSFRQNYSLSHGVRGSFRGEAPGPDCADADPGRQHCGTQRPCQVIPALHGAELAASPGSPATGEIHVEVQTNGNHVGTWSCLSAVAEVKEEKHQFV
jgi:hypothetical protein